MTRLWSNPLPLDLVPVQTRADDAKLPAGTTGLPVLQHPGAFGIQRKHHIHEGVDLYAPEGTTVRAVETGMVVAIERFTGAHCDVPSPWWENTWAVLVEGASGVVVYGEVSPELLRVGDRVVASERVGYVKRVLKKDKGYPMSMLHIELHDAGTRQTYEWVDERPYSLGNPTGELLLLVMDKIAPGAAT